MSSGTLLRLDPPIPLNTPRGQAYAHFLQDAGDERDMLWTCFHEDGQIWTWPNYDVRACRNVTLGRDNPEKPERRDSNAKGTRMAKHPGFKKVAAGIAKKEGVSSKAAGAILASKTRGASAAAKQKNPNLRKVK